MTRNDFENILRDAGVEGEHVERALDQYDATAADRAAAECESREAAAFEDAAHGYDFDDDHKYDPYTGVSEYDLNPGTTYNDAGEPRGYM